MGNYSRLDLQKIARAKGSHTRFEWAARIRECGFACYYCGISLSLKRITKDHKTPICRGGSDGIENVVPACRSCNQRKAWRTEDEYRAEVGRLSTVKAIRVAISKSKPFRKFGARIVESDLLKNPPRGQPPEEQRLLEELLDERKGYGWW